MKRIPIPLSLPLPALIAGALSFTANAADPTWWAARGITNVTPQSNLSPATIGQAKHMVSQALAELQTRLDTPTFQALQADVAAVVNLAVPITAEDKAKQLELLLVGQLKAISAPFYNRLRGLDAVWVNRQMHESNSRIFDTASPPVYSPYPWSQATTDDSNYAPATVGQLKAVFSLRFEVWGVPESGDPPPPSGTVDTDGDGLSDVTELAIGTSPTLLDTDGDGHMDASDYFPLDPSRWIAPSSTPGDLMPPTIQLESPATATYVAGP